MYITHINNQLYGGWKCNKCNLSVKTSYSMRRHIENKHSEDDAQLVNTDIQVSVHTASVTSENQDSFQDPGNISNILKVLGLELNEGEFMEMVRDIGNRYNTMGTPPYIEKGCRKYK